MTPQASARPENASAVAAPDRASRAVKVSVRGVSKRFGDVVASDRISLDIYEGEFLTLLGSSGSGKTTLMRIIAGLEPCDEGTIRIDGADVTHLPPRRRNLGMVFQQYSLFPHMSVAENIGYGLSIKGWSRDRIAQRVKEMLELIRLPEIGARAPSQLSGGQQQRVALARALATNPSLLMLDEPLGALDLKLRQQLQGELRRIHRQTGTTFLFVTHDQEEALHLSDRIAVMRHGAIEQLAPPQDVYEQPATEFVAGFVGDVTLLPCRRDPVSGRIAVENLGTIDLPISGPQGSFKLVVRPEHVQLQPAGSPGGLQALIEDIVHEGSTTVYELRLPTGLALKARALGSPPSNVQVGEVTGFSISGARTWVGAAP